MEQMHWAYFVGDQRVKNARERDLRPKFSYENEHDELVKHTYGALAELAFAVWMGLRWDPHVGDFHDVSDVAPFWEVRHRTHQLGLKVATNDRLDQLVVDVTGTRPTFEIHGFITAEWARTHVPLSDPGNRHRPAHFVPFRYLTPINEDFHTVHAWYRHPLMGWLCLYCGELYEEA